MRLPCPAMWPREVGSWVLLPCTTRLFGFDRAPTAIGTAHASAGIVVVFFFAFPGLLLRLQRVRRGSPQTVSRDYRVSQDRLSQFEIPQATVNSTFAASEGTPFCFAEAGGPESD